MKGKEHGSSSLPSVNGNKEEKNILFFPKAGTTAMGRKTVPFPWSLQAGCALALQQEEERKRYVYPMLV